ncbi:MAG: cytochrome c biogenesis protein CcdA [Myxococcales bacterium]
MAVPFTLLGIFAAGLLTFASPCILPLAPVYLGLLGGVALDGSSGRSRVGRTLLAASAFALGLGLVFVLMGMAATALGATLVRHRSLLLQLGGLAVFLFGLKYLGVLNLPWLEQDVRPGLARASGRTILGAFVMGAAFGLGWTPCIGPVLGSVLTFAATSTTDPLRGASLLAAYAAGLALPLVAAALVAPLALRLFERARRWMRPMQLATGGILAVVGLLLITDHMDLLAPATVVPQPEPTASIAAAGAEKQPSETCPTAAATGPAACSLPPAEESVSPRATEAMLAPAGAQMVEFVGRTCPVCLRMAPVVKAAERGCAGHSVTVRRIEVDGEGGRALARRYGVLGVPTFLFLDASGEEVARLVGEQPLEQLEQSLRDPLRGPVQGLPRAAAIAGARGGRAPAEAVSVLSWPRRPASPAPPAPSPGSPWGRSGWGWCGTSPASS